MANEARVFAEGVENCITRQFTVADATAIAKGALLVHNASSRTAIAHDVANSQCPLGFATHAKDASDGQTTIGLQRTGVVVAYIDGSVHTGQVVMASDTTVNRVQAIDTTGTISYQAIQRIVGRALETGTDGQAIKIALSLG